jgi:hypothetical protein
MTSQEDTLARQRAYIQSPEVKEAFSKVRYRVAIASERARGQAYVEHLAEDAHREVGCCGG